MCESDSLDNLKDGTVKNHRPPPETDWVLRDALTPAASRKRGARKWTTSEKQRFLRTSLIFFFFFHVVIMCCVCVYIYIYIYNTSFDGLTFNVYSHNSLIKKLINKYITPPPPIRLKQMKTQFEVTVLLFFV